MQPRRPARTGRKSAILVTAAAVAAAVCGPAASAKAVPSQPTTPAASAGRTAAPKTASRSLPIRTSPPLPGGDEIVVGRGDSDGWHLYAAASAAPGAWHPLATLDPAQLNPSGQTWIGRECLTGDGRYVVAVIAPWSANNSSAGMDRGGIAYVVDAHTGAVRPLLSGVSLHYFTPSCGTGSQVALTSFAGSDEQSTQLVTASAASAHVLSVQRMAGEYTSAVPAGDGGIIAARGDSIVHVNKGQTTTLATVKGEPFNLVANAAGGADFLLGAGKTASVWTTDRRGTRQVGTGSFDRLALFQGRSGRTVAAGVDRLEGSSDIVALPHGVSNLEAASLDGTMTAPAPTDTTRQGAGTPLPLRLQRAGRTGAPWTPDAAAPPTEVLPPLLTETGALIASPSDTGSGAGSGALKATNKAGTAAASAAATTPPFVSDCAVGRDNVYLQAMQPIPAQVDWAANLAGRSLLQGQYARPANFDNLNLPAGYSPSLDFPLPAPFGAGGDSIPREVLEGIFAQESNFNQASWHSVEGVAGDPLIADYYGAGGGYVVGVQAPDCGYGLGQITTGMHTGDMSYDLQRKVAVDYAENAAAAAQILAEKWNETAADGITAGDGRPSTLESWYFAIWDYNSGIEPNAAHGNPSGCAPGPSCTGPDGTWGLGWANNPANPAYPYNRHPFLHEDAGTGTCVTGPCRTYGDAATPGDWPYQEKVFGWMQVPLTDAATGEPAYVGTMYSWDPITSSVQLNIPWEELNQPGVNAFCSMSANDCDPTKTPGTCTLSDSYCWWHSADQWCNQNCTGGSWEYNQGDVEPPNGNGNVDPIQVCSVDTSVIPAGSTIVDSQPTDVNLQGCDPSNTNWRSSGSFAFSYGDPANPNAQATDMDVHQLGAGLGGHMFFTHTGEPTDANGEPYWGVTGTWSPNLLKGRYQVEVFVPDAGATSPQADYTVHNGLGFSRTVTVNQNASNGWVGLGDFWLGPAAAVTLTNVGVTPPGDLAFSAVAFVPAPIGNYVMLGDSYSSGEGVGAGLYDLDTDNFQTTCTLPGTTTTYSCTNNGHRSALSYNRMFASKTTSFGAVTDYNDPAKNWSDVACSGAVIGDFSSQNINGSCPNEGPQADALNTNTSLVTLTFGGNDLGFAPIIKDCIGIGAGTWFGILAASTTCKSKDGVKLASDVSGLTNAAGNGTLDLLYRAIRAAAPNAEVVVLGYPRMFIGTQAGSPGRCIKDGWITDDDQDWLNGAAASIDDSIEEAADRAGFYYLDTLNTFNDHELCATSGGVSTSWFTGMLDPNSFDTYDGFTSYVSGVLPRVQQQFFHPNTYGYAAEAGLLAGKIQVP